MARELHSLEICRYGIDLQIVFDYIPGKPATLEQPEEYEEIEIVSVIPFGNKEVLDELTQKEYESIRAEIWQNR